MGAKAGVCTNTDQMSAAQFDGNNPGVELPDIGSGCSSDGDKQPPPPLPPPPPPPLPLQEHVECGCLQRASTRVTGHTIAWPASVDFTFDLSRSNGLTVIFVAYAIFTFFVFIVSGASVVSERAVTDTGIGSEHVAHYLFGMLYVPLLSPLTWANNPFRKRALHGVSLLWLLLINAQAWYFLTSSADFSSEGGGGEGGGAEGEAHEKGMALSVLDAGGRWVTVSATLSLLFVLDVMFLRLLLTPQNMFVKRRDTNLAHTRRMLRGAGRRADGGGGGGGVAAAGGAAAAAAAAAAGGACAAGSTVLAAGGGTGDGMRRYSALHLSRGALLLDVIERLRPLYESAAPAAAAVAAAAATADGEGKGAAAAAAAAHEKQQRELRRVAALVVGEIQGARDAAQEAAAAATAAAAAAAAVAARQDMAAAAAGGGSGAPGLGVRMWRKARALTRRGGGEALLPRTASSAGGGSGPGGGLSIDGDSSSSSSSSSSSHSQSSSSDGRFSAATRRFSAATLHAADAVTNDLLGVDLQDMARSRSAMGVAVKDVVDSFAQRKEVSLFSSFCFTQLLCAIAAHWLGACHLLPSCELTPPRSPASRAPPSAPAPR